MVIQYPHTAQCKIAPPAVQDENGNWITPEPIIAWEHKGRLEPRSSSAFLQGVDGKQITFTSIFYMPLPVPDIKPESMIEVFDKFGNLMVRETAKQFSRGQLNARIWL
jgi:hypothetical protein